MAVGGALDIRDVKPSSFDLLASSLGITSSYLRSIVAPIVDNAEAAIREAGSESLGPSQEFLPYLADDLQEDIAPRLRVLEEFTIFKRRAYLLRKLFSVRPISPLPERKSARRLNLRAQLSQPARVDGKALELDSPTLKCPTTRRPTAWLSRACRRMCGYDSFGPFVPFDSASRSLRGKVSSVDPTR